MMNPDRLPGLQIREMSKKHELIEKSKNVLIVEDDKDLMDFLKFAVEDYPDIKFHFTLNPDEAEAIIGQDICGIGFIDWSANGEGLCRKLKEMDPDNLAVAFSAGQKEKILECPYISGFLGKPFDLVDLRESIYANISLWKQAKGFSNS